MSLSNSERAPEWTPARLFLAVSVLYHVPLGIAGLLVDQSFPLSPGAAADAGSGHIFGTFETNGWHSVAGLFIGAVSLIFALRPRYAREAALAIGFGHVGVVLALAIWDPSTFLFASNAADQFIHSATAIGGIVTGLSTPARSKHGSFFAARGVDASP